MEPIGIGTTLGSYQITALLGKGGMGEVYRGLDTKLNREVAIKVLPEEFSRDPDRVARVAKIGVPEFPLLTFTRLCGRHTYRSGHPCR